MIHDFEDAKSGSQLTIKYTQTQKECLLKLGANRLLDCVPDFVALENPTHRQRSFESFFRLDIPESLWYHTGFKAVFFTTQLPLNVLIHFSHACFVGNGNRVGRKRRKGTCARKFNYYHQTEKVRTDGTVADEAAQQNYTERRHCASPHRKNWRTAPRRAINDMVAGGFRAPASPFLVPVGLAPVEVEVPDCGLSISERQV